ncbi:MAG: SpoIID/LytB domain-containing protein [Clostridiales bacterium]|nr:SpoIID/LytB domain-containing protein [Clostridiales bacterium]
MKVRLLSLNQDKAMPFVRFQARVTSSIKNYANGDEDFQHCNNLRGLFNALQDALNEDEIIIIAVDIRNYGRLKTALGQAFETEMVYNPSVLNMLESDESVGEEERKEFSLFPEPATVFLSKDGLYSGFGMGNGEQAIIVLPIDNDRINLILRNGLIPYLEREFEDVAKNIKSENQLFDNERVQIAVERLLENKSIVAVDANKNAEVLRSCGDQINRFDEVFVFTTSVEDQGDVNPTEYAANKARVSFSLSAANLGASISEIYTADDQKYICIAVADDDSALVRKLFIEDGETDNQFIENCSYELIELIGEKAAGIKSIGIEINDNAAVIPEEERKEPTKKSLVFAILLGIIVIVAAVFAVIYNLHNGNGASAKWLRNLFGYKTTAEDTTTETTVPIETTSKKAPSSSEKIKLSDMILADLIKIEKKKQEEATETETQEETTAETTTEDETESQSEGEENESATETTTLTETTTEVEEDKGAPEFIKVNGENIEAKEAIARFVMTEMDQTYDEEAWKAQAVVIYTYLKYRDNDFEIDGVEIVDNYTDEVLAAVEDVFGEYITYNGEIALTPYFEVAANSTADADTVFSRSYPYLKAVTIDGNPDAASPNYKNEVKLKLGEVQGMLLDYNSDLKLGDAEVSWIRITEKDTAVSQDIGYVSEVSVGDMTVSGYEFVTEIMNSKLASNCFKVNFDDTNKEFTFTTYGIGYGVGMSKTGANYLAKDGKDYKRILQTYYNGTDISKEENV